MSVVVLGCLLPVYWHYRVHNVFNVFQFAMAFFISLNTFIYYCEMCLFFRASYIADEHEKAVKKYRGNELSAPLDWFTKPLTAENIHSTAWAEMWSTYSVFDRVYADNISHGFWIDSGNGFCTLLPGLLLLVSMTVDVGFVTPRTVGIVSLITFWTEFYGTVIYLAAYFYHENQKVVGWLNTVLFVLCTNGIWFVMPLLGMKLSIDLMFSNSALPFRI